MANAAAAFVGQNLGANQPERVEKGVWVALRITVIYFGVLSIFYFFLARPLVQGFVEEATAISYGVNALQVFAIGYVFFGVGMIPVQALNGAGDTGTPMLMNFVCFWLIEIPLGYWLGQELGYEVTGVVSAVVTAEVILSGLALWVFARGRWKETTV